MKMSQLAFRPEKTPPKDAETVNHKLLVQAGFVRQLMAGVYTYLPFGLRTLKKIEQIVREEMDAIGGEEGLMPHLHPAEIWKTTGGWDSVDVLFKLKSRTEEEFERFYNIVKEAYKKIFSRLGLDSKVTEASGGAFSEKISYEFEVLTDAGEANILYCQTCDFCVNVDDIQTYKEGDPCPRCGKDKLKSALASEVGNVFDLGQKYTKAFDLTYVDQKGERHYPVMGCYGIGVSRTMGVIVEKFHDERGIIWPENIAPFKVSLVSMKETAEKA